MARIPDRDAEKAARSTLQSPHGEEGVFLRDWRLVEDVALDGNRGRTDDEQLLAALTLIDALRRDADSYERWLLEALRDREDPVAWPSIATALGVTRQGAERRYLRAVASGARYADRARTLVKARRESQEHSRRLAVARWGQDTRATQDWHLELRVRTPAGEETTVRLGGYEESLPDLRQPVRVGDGYEMLNRLTVLEVVEEVTPWPDVNPPGTLAGLSGVDQE